MRAGTAGSCRAVAAALGALALAAPAGAAAKGAVYSSPHYTGHAVPKAFVPAQPPRPVVLPVRGGRPHVFVDAAGTAHIAYTDPAGSADDVIRTCRLPRGGSACAAQAALTPRQPSGGGNGPQTNQDFDGPFPLAVGNQLLVVDSRCCNDVDVGGQSYGNPVYLFTSEDAGTTFTGPSDPNGTAGIIGTQDPSGDVVVYGGDVPSIGLISDTQTDGLFFQGVPAGSFTSAKALLSTDELSSGTLGVDGIRPVAAFSNSGGSTTVREWTGNGSVDDAAQWTTLHLAADRPRIAGGPAGMVLLTQSSISDGPLFVRRVAPGGGSVTAPVRLTASIAHSPALSADPVSGRFAAAWIDNADASVHVRTSADGRVWSPDQVVARVPGGDLGELDVAATADRGGFVVMRDAAGGTTVDDGRILAAQFGNAAATGRPGLGLVPGGSGPPAGDTKAYVACTQVHFGIVDALATAGCFLRDPKNPTGGAAVAQSTVRLNGLDLVPDAGSRIFIDPRAHTIDTSGPIRVQLTGSATGPITLWHGELHVKVPEASAGQTLFDFSTDDFAVGVKGFPVDGRIQVKLLADAVEIPIHLALPAYFGGVHGDATLRANNAEGLVLKSLEIGVDDAFVGPLELKDFDISYRELGEQWHGAGTAVLPGPATPTLKGSVDFENGAFKHGFVSFSLYATVPVFTDVYLDTVSLGFGLHPTVFEGGVDLGAQPLGGRLYTIEMNGRIKVQIGDEAHPTIVFVGGSGAILGLDVAEMSFTYNSDGYVLFHVLVHLGEPDDDWFHVAAGGDVYLVHGDFGAQLNVDGCAAYLCASLKAAASKRGIAVCDTGENAGADIDWDDPLNPHVHLTSCHISRYTVAVPAPGGRAADGERTFVVPPGQEGYELELHGQGGPPNVTVVSPGGVVSTPDAAPGARSAVVGARDAKGTVAVVGLRRPAAGTWRIRPVAGSPAVTAMLVAHTVALPKVRARVTGSGARRRLRYTVRGLSGDASVRFVEQTSSGTVGLGLARNGTRTIAFRPSAGPGGRRAIRAVVATGGFARSRAVVARFTAPRLRRPGRVGSLSARRHGTSVRVRVGRSAGALRTVVLLRVADGTAVQKVTTRRSVTFRGVRRGLRATVAAAGVNVRGTRGPRRTARVR
jgi:hypothetical protein